MKKPTDRCLWCGTVLLLTLKTVCIKPLYAKHNMIALADMCEPHRTRQQMMPDISKCVVCALQRCLQ